MSTEERNNRIVALVVFLISFITYLKTIAPTTSFWDCGEFITCSYVLGVPHPPGAPLFIALGRIFTMIPWALDIGFRVNLISVIASALTVMFTYLIIVRLIKEWRGQPKSTEDQIIAYTSGLIGALAYAFTDTFWFNAVEAEVYALSMFFTSIVVWLILVWSENAQEYKNERLLLLIAYFFGLATGVHLLNLLTIPTILIIIYFRNANTLLKPNLWGLAFLLILVGYSTYLLLFIRSGLNPPVDENNPENWANIISYLRRDQYGQESLFATMFTRKSPFWEYQIKKMYLRYFGWQFIGKGHILGSDGFIREIISFRGLMGLPFLLGIIGMVHHFFKDKKRALSVLVLFIMTGVAIVLYLNQEDPQPRERDYVYVGSFFAFALWIGIGVTALLEWISESFKKNLPSKKIAMGGVIALLFVIVPGYMFSFNYRSHDRSGNYVAYDYSYNILQSCEKDAILFTNGDNDTFPLWFLQFVYGIRQDVRVVNLSLLNTHWYIKQLKYEEPGVPISLSDEVIDHLAARPWPEARTVKIPVPKEAREKELADLKERKEFIEPKEDVTELTFELTPTIFGSGIRVQDIMVLNIIIANQFRKPVYFAVTVSRDNMLNLHRYLRMDGLAFKLVTYPDQFISPSRLRENLFEKFQYRSLNNPKVYFNNNIIGLLTNYRAGFLRLANYYREKKRYEDMLAVLDKMEEVMPEEVIPIKDKRIVVSIGKMYQDGGRPEEFEKRLNRLLKKEGIRPENKLQYANIFYQFLKKDARAESLYREIINENPNMVQAYSWLLNLYTETKQYQSAIELLEDWLKIRPDDSYARQRIKELKRLAMAQDTTTGQRE